MATQNSQFQEETSNNQRNITSSINNLEVQMGQIVQQITGSQAQGSLPSATVKNPQEHNNVSVVITRSGKSIETPKDKSGEEDHFLEVDLETKDNQLLKKKSHQNWLRRKNQKNQDQPSDSHILRERRRRTNMNFFREVLRDV